MKIPETNPEAALTAGDVSLSEATTPDLKEGIKNLVGEERGEALLNSWHAFGQALRGMPISRREASVGAALSVVGLALTACFSPQESSVPAQTPERVTPTKKPIEPSSRTTISTRRATFTPRDPEKATDEPTESVLPSSTKQETKQQATATSTATPATPQEIQPPTATPSEIPVIKIETAIPIPEIVLQLGHHYTLAHPAFRFEVEMTTNANFNNDGYSQDRDYRVTTFKGQPKILPLRLPIPQATTILLHGDRYKDQPLPGQVLIEETEVGGSLKKGDIMTLEDKETGEKIALQYLGRVVKEAGYFKKPDKSYWHENAIQTVTEDENAPAHEVKNQNRNIVAILSCIPPNYEFQIVFAFVPVESKPASAPQPVE